MSWKDFTDDLTVNIVAGIMFSTIVYFANKYMRPYIEKFFYSGYSVAGTWEIVHPADMPESPDTTEVSFPRYTTVELKQSGKLISGTATSARTTEPRKKIDYKVTGKIENNIIKINFENSSNQSLACSTFLLMPSENSAHKQLSGYRLYYSLVKNTISSSICIFKPI